MKKEHEGYRALRLFEEVPWSTQEVEEQIDLVKLTDERLSLLLARTPEGHFAVGIEIYTAAGYWRTFPNNAFGVFSSIKDATVFYCRYAMDRPGLFSKEAKDILSARSVKELQGDLFA